MTEFKEPVLQVDVLLIQWAVGGLVMGPFKEGLGAAADINKSEAKAWPCSIRAARAQKSEQSETGYQERFQKRREKEA